MDSGSTITYDLNELVQVSPLSKLAVHLNSHQQQMLRRLSHTLRPPIDAPRLAQVLRGATIAVDAFGDTLIRPNTDFRNIATAMQAISNVAADIRHTLGIPYELENPLLRRMSKYAAWALSIELGAADNDNFLLEAAGVEIAVSIATGKSFPNGYANNLRRALASKTATSNSNIEFTFETIRHIEKARRTAFQLFEDLSNQPPTGGEDTSQSVESRIHQHLKRKLTYASPNHRRGVLDRQGQSKLQALDSSQELRERAEAGDASASLMILSFLTGLSLDISADIPLANHVKDDWLMTVDLECGVIKTNIESLFEDSATPPVEMAHNYRPANKVIVKPIPEFLQTILLNRYAHFPTAIKIGDLLKGANTSGKSLTILGTGCGIAPTASRFINSAPQFAIQTGIGRLAAASITNDFSITPGAKLYYARINREEIWQASTTLFSTLGWGAPVPFQQGLPAGSLIAATRSSVTELFQWMAVQVAALSPGRRYTLESLLNHHNSFVFFCASLAILCLASRQAEKLGLTAQQLNADHFFISMFDKRTGQFPGPSPVPINGILAEQIRLFHIHCSTLDSRLAKCGIEENSRLRTHIKKVLDRRSVHLFFRINTQHRQVAIGTSDLTAWWPDNLRLTGNFSRSFWQVELHEQGIPEPIIDLFVRHQLLGMESHTSTTAFNLYDAFLAICRAQENVLDALGIGAISGVAKR